MIDVIIIKKDSDALYDQLINSIPDDKNIQVCVFPFDETGVGNARKYAIENTNNEYVCFLDPDDYMIGNPFPKAMKILSNGYTAYYTNHYLLKGEKIQKKWFDTISTRKIDQLFQMHHIIFYKRKIIEEYTEITRNVITKEKLIFNLASLTQGKVLGDIECHYAWRIDGNQTHKTNSDVNNPEEWKKATSDLRNYLIKLKF
jgi:hypothetical protein